MVETQKHTKDFVILVILVIEIKKLMKDFVILIILVIWGFVGLGHWDGAGVGL